MGTEPKPGQMGESIMENLRMDYQMVMEMKFRLMDRGMQGNSRMGKKHGHGKFTYTDGSWYDGSWKDGQSWTGKTYSKDGNISYKKKNGEIQY